MAQEAHTSFNIFPTIQSMPGATTMHFRWNFYEYSRGKLNLFLPGESECEQNLVIGRAKRAPHWGVQSRFRVIYIIGERSEPLSRVFNDQPRGIYVIVINQMRGLYEIYKSRDTRAKPEWQGFMNRVQTERWFITIL